MAYNLHKREPKDYKKLSDSKIPRAIQYNSREKLYPLEVIETDCHRVKVHYIRYGESDDEWRNSEDIVGLNTHYPEVAERYTPFALHRELAFQLKLALDACNHRDPEVRIELPFDSSY